MNPLTITWATRRTGHSKKSAIERSLGRRLKKQIRNYSSAVVFREDSSRV